MKKKKPVDKTLLGYLKDLGYSTAIKDMKASYDYMKKNRDDLRRRHSEISYIMAETLKRIQAVEKRHG